jgi:hypothetical protein
MSTATVEIPTHEQVLNFVGATRKMLIGSRVDRSCVGTFPIVTMTEERKKVERTSSCHVWSARPEAISDILRKRLQR